VGRKGRRKNQERTDRQRQTDKCNIIRERYETGVEKTGERRRDGKRERKMKRPTDRNIDRNAKYSSLQGKNNYEIIKQSCILKRKRK
jgi:hypothetical protein